MSFKRKFISADFSINLKIEEGAGFRPTPSSIFIQKELVVLHCRRFLILTILTAFHFPLFHLFFDLVELGALFGG